MQVHPSQISPGEPFDVFYFLRNHTDSTTYYIQAKVYDVRTGELLATHALAQSPTNARLFIKTIDAPPDPSGYGRNIVAIATVYTDSGFSAKSDNYEEQEQYYLIKGQVPLFGGGGVDYRIIGDMLDERLEKALQKLPKPEKATPKEADMSFVERILGHLGVIERELGRVPKQGADLSEISDQIADLGEMVQARPQFERTDLSSLAEAVQSVLATLEQAAGELKRGNAQLVQVFEAALQNFAKTFGDEIGAKIDDAVANQEITLPLSFTPRQRKPQQTAAPGADISSLMS